MNRFDRFFEKSQEEVHILWVGIVSHEAYTPHLKKAVKDVSKGRQSNLLYTDTKGTDQGSALMPLSQTIRIKAKTNHDLLAHVFPLLATAACISFKF